MKYTLEVLTKKGPLDSSDIQRDLVLNYGLSRDAARKRIQRLHDSGDIQRFMRLKAGGYLYYIPKVHPKDLVIKIAKMYLDTHRPELGRIIRLIDRFKVLSVYEICRLANLDAIGKNKEISPELRKILQELELLEYDLQPEFFITSSSLKPGSVDKLIKKAEEKFEEEANLLYVARNYFLEHRLANKLQLYRIPSHVSLVNKFDAFGHGGWRKRSQIILECHARRIVLPEDMIGYRRRVFSTIYKGKKYRPVPTFCYMLAYQFSKEALDFAFSKGIRPITVEYGNGNFLFHVLETVPKNKTKRSSLRGRLADAQGRAFEAAVEKTFKRKGMKTSRRKYFYLDDGRISETDTGRPLTDIDIFAQDEEKGEALLVECKSAKKQISRNQLLRIVKNFGKIAHYLKIEKNFSASAIIIGYFNELDMIDAKRRSGTPITFFTPRKFRQNYRKELEGEPRWLFQ